MFRCGSEEGPARRHLEIPQRMFDLAACCRVRLAAAPVVGCEALLDLKVLLRSVPGQGPDFVLQAQHHGLGGADAKITEPTEGHSIRTVSSVVEEPADAGVAARSPREDGMARRLREHSGRVLVSGRGKEARDE